MKAIAVTAQVAIFLVPIYTILLGFILTILWGMISTAIIAWYPSPRRTGELADSKERMLVAFYNSNCLENAIEYLTGYTFGPLFKDRSAPRWSGLSLFIPTVIFWLAKQAVSIFVSSLLVVGKFAPANPGAVFIPQDPINTKGISGLRRQALMVPAAMRSLATWQKDSEIRTRVDISTSDPSKGDAPESPNVAIEYSYSINGYDFGLSSLSSLRQSVIGKCVTDYTWLQPSNGSGVNVYSLWNSSSPDQQKAITWEATSQDPTYALVFNKPDYISTTTADGNRSYAFLVSSAGSTSYTASTDPWYLTGTSALKTSSHDSPLYTVLPFRPALSCWQQDTWFLNGQKRGSIFNLRDVLPGNQHSAWLALLENSFVVPKRGRAWSLAGRIHSRLGIYLSPA